MHTVANLLQELQQLLKGQRDVGDGVAVESPSLLAAHLLERSVSDLERAGSFYEDGLPRTHALEYLARRVSEAQGFELAQYDDEAVVGLYLKVPVHRAPLVVGPDERRDVPSAFWALDRRGGLVVSVQRGHRGIEVECWSAEPGKAFRFVEELDRGVEGCALVRGRALRLRDEDYTFLALRPPRVEPRYEATVETALETVAAFFERGEPGERLGSLWYGPPGNGKTSMVRKLLRRHEDATRLWVDPAALQPGTLEKTFALLARILRSLAPTEAALVVFEDIDLLSGERGATHMRTWLSALDGVEQYECRLCFVGLTNLPPREFDPAVVRPARLGDLVVEFGPPDRERRRLILSDHLGELVEGEALDVLATRAQGLSGAELELLCRRVRWARRDAEAAALSQERLESLVRELRPQLTASAVGFLRERAE